jgi:hypothetical protein
MSICDHSPTAPSTPPPAGTSRDNTRCSVCTRAYNPHSSVCDDAESPHNPPAAPRKYCTDSFSGPGTDKAVLHSSNHPFYPYTATSPEMRFASFPDGLRSAGYPSACMSVTLSCSNWRNPGSPFAATPPYPPPRLTALNPGELSSPTGLENFSSAARND